ncbi:AraC family transcriptional regulator [Anaerocolumna aminovalerica]|uniref:AraC-type DNA-binding protein n=1 Tax=Anaerocolumna aminovalerica TaxID=1527 RepID=A0A1I5FVZ5_9FIRM|nr:AraC family transcriptional regulator [Anaerocolumna aminovalerica]MBU5330878.1 AraC family transcriptional regulator [Anaerocolumna aminovalerica]MDU6265111.1 AraC family transcriptional regulator [Anaerocolumna aminovalerica]SFO27773.1 AraC-type DNA-binding protein [Anaerocolumna aminovalerica]
MSIKTIENMVNWVEENIEECPTLEEMSDFVGYSPCYCSTKFHEYVGVSFKDYIQKRQLSMAAVALQKTKGRIIDIAIQYGFSSHEAFTRAFTRAYGYTPFQYRKLLPEILTFDKVQIDLKTPQ